LIHASFFFVDIVGLSDPYMSTMTQMKKIETLNQCIRESDVFKSIPREMILVLPTGDGVAIGFLQGPELPLRLSIEIHRRLEQYNRGKIPSETVRIRIGIHGGNVFVVNDVLGNRNVWGPGIIIARRVMDLGDDGHILLSPRMAEDLRELSDYYKQIIKPVHDYSIKHGQTLLIYSAFGKGFGNPKPPLKGSYQRTKMGREITRLRKSALYPLIHVHMSITDSETNLVHYKRMYEIKNVADDSIYHIVHGITSDVEKTFEDLHIKVYDENSNDLKISSISIDKLTHKEFTTVFNNPIEKGEQRRFTLEYDLEEPHRYFENAFLVACDKFVFTFDMPENMKPPVVHEINIETGEKKKCSLQPTKVKNNNNSDHDLDKRDKKDARSLVRWARKDIAPGQSFDFQW
jgi:hypothetical protein